MSYADPDRSGYTVTEEDRDPSRFTIIPRDAVQQSVFNQIHSIPPEQLYAEARPGVPMPHRRTPKGHRPIILVGYNESQSAISFELTFHPPVTVRVFVPKDSWNRGTCGPENVRAAIQKAYLNTLRGDLQPVIVKPTSVSLNVTHLRSHPPTRHHQHHPSIHHGPRYTNPYRYSPTPPPARHDSYSSNSTPTTPDSSTHQVYHYDPYQNVVFRPTHVRHQSSPNVHMSGRYSPHGVIPNLKPSRPGKLRRLFGSGL
jgi:hypothetical protein